MKFKVLEEAQEEEIPMPLVLPDQNMPEMGGYVTLAVNGKESVEMFRRKFF